jgi:hypothetical protein
MTQDQGNTLVGTQVSEPVPVEEAFDGYHETLTIGGNGLEKGFWSGFHVAVYKHLTVMAQDANVHASGV